MNRHFIKGFLYGVTFKIEQWLTETGEGREGGEDKPFDGYNVIL